MKIFKAKNIPNLLSVLRLMMVPLFIYLFFAEFENHRPWALAVFLAASATDVLDGWLARRNNWVTDLGKIIDPLADKLMQFSAFVSLAIKSKYGIILAVCIFVKDILMMFGGIVLSKKGARDLVVAKWYGKLNTCVIALTVCVLILYYEKETLAAVMTGISAAVMLFAFLMYFFNIFLKYMRSAKNKDAAGNG